MKPAHLLSLSLLALVALFAAWFAQNQHAVAAMLVFAVPPLVLAIAAWRGWRRAGFVSAVAALFWFSHGVMVAWAHAGERAYALLEILLALVVIYAACLPGIRARSAKRA